MSKIGEKRGLGNVGKTAADTLAVKKKKITTAEDHDGGGASRVSIESRVNPGRVRVLKEGTPGKAESAAAAARGRGGGGGGGGGGPVVLWISRDQRVRDNWAMLWAAERARDAGVPLLVTFNLVDSFLGAGGRHYGFMLRGLRELEGKLKDLNVHFFLLQGDPEQNVPSLLARTGASLLVMDFSPLRIGRQWRAAMCQNVPASVAVHEVDAHNVVPVWVVSEKQETAARTIRPKIHRNLPEYLREYPPLVLPTVAWEGEQPPTVEWDALIKRFTEAGKEVPEVGWCVAGEDAGLRALTDEKKGFLVRRLAKYDSDRNDPGIKEGTSGLSPWLHYGHLAAQRCALEARKARAKSPKAADAFLEELIVRSELADNFCYYQPHYDSLQGAASWAQETLQKHAGDKREFIYTKEQLELGKTYDKLWNAAQWEMVHYGKMHGFMRMYWAKKILEWTPSPEEALEIAIHLNDKYSLDGRDSNGYVGCMWSICGIHDQGWGERPIFGKIRYMNYNGCKRKFNVDGYIQYVGTLVSAAKKRLKEQSAEGSEKATAKAPAADIQPK